MSKRKKVTSHRPSTLRNAFNVTLECGHSAVCYGVGKLAQQPPKTAHCRDCEFGPDNIDEGRPRHKNWCANQNALFPETGAESCEGNQPLQEKKP